MGSVEVEGAEIERLEPPKEALEQVLQECEQDMADTDEALSDIGCGSDHSPQANSQISR